MIALETQIFLFILKFVYLHFVYRRYLTQSYCRFVAFLLAFPSRHLVTLIWLWSDRNIWCLDNDFLVDWQVDRKFLLSCLLENWLEVVQIRPEKRTKNWMKWSPKVDPEYLTHTFLTRSHWSTFEFSRTFFFDWSLIWSVAFYRPIRKKWNCFEWSTPKKKHQHVMSKKEKRQNSKVL